MTTYFISRHSGAVEWAKEQNFSVDKWISHLDNEQIVSGDIVVGTLPVNIAADLILKGARYFSLNLALSAADRGIELTKEDLYRLKAELVEYQIQKVSNANV